MWYTVSGRRKGRFAPVGYFFLLLFLRDLLEEISFAVLTMMQIVETIARSASERSFIISLNVSSICLPPSFDYVYIIAHKYVLVKSFLQFYKSFLESITDALFFYAKGGGTRWRN